MAIVLPRLRRTGRLLQAAALLAGTAGLLLQFSISIPARLAAGHGLGGALVWFFSYFTILTNLGAVAVHAATLAGRSGSFFHRPRVRAGTAVAMVVVMLVYVTVLAPLWRPHGVFLLADGLLHYVTPLLFLLWWLLAGADGSSRWADIGYWLIYPFIYAAYAMARGRLTGEVPYPFLNAARNGWAGVVIAMALIALLFLLLGALFVAFDRFLARSPVRRPPR
jgi:hypothetical protein